MIFPHAREHGPIHGAPQEVLVPDQLFVATPAQDPLAGHPAAHRDPVHRSVRLEVDPTPKVSPCRVNSDGSHHIPPSARADSPRRVSTHRPTPVIGQITD